MLDKNILIRNLEDFKNTEKYSAKQLAEFLSKNPVTASFYKKHVDKFKLYIRQYPRAIIKYSKEDNKFLKLSYTKEELNVVWDIQEKYLVTFWIIDLAKDGIDISNYLGAKKRFAFDTYDGDEPIIDLIDYVIKFCIIPYSDGTEKINIGLSETERTILEYIHKGWSVPQIADEMNISKHTVENHKKNICIKVDDLKLDEFNGLKALAKLNLLAQKILP